MNAGPRKKQANLWSKVCEGYLALLVVIFDVKLCLCSCPLCNLLCLNMGYKTFRESFRERAL